MTDKKRVSSADVQIAYLSKGMDAVTEMLDGHKRAPALIKHAYESLIERGADVGQFEAWIAKNMSFRSRNGGRTYRVQQAGNNRPFVLIPLTSINVKKGENIWVNFSDGQITIQPVA